MKLVIALTLSIICVRTNAFPKAFEKSKYEASEITAEEVEVDDNCSRADCSNITIKSECTQQELLEDTGCCSKCGESATRKAGQSQSGKGNGNQNQSVICIQVIKTCCTQADYDAEKNKACKECPRNPMVVSPVCPSTVTTVPNGGAG